MANIKSQKKRILTNEKARLRNNIVKSELKTATRKVKAAVEAQNQEAAVEALRFVNRSWTRLFPRVFCTRRPLQTRSPVLLRW